MPRPSVRNPTSRVYRHPVTRQLDASLILPHMHQHGFTHPRDEAFLVGAQRPSSTASWSDSAGGSRQRLPAAGVASSTNAREAS
jgi:hypothetical protein